MKIQTRATLLFSFLTSSIILVFSVFIYFFTSQYAFEDFFKRLETRVNVASAIHLNINAAANKKQIQQMRLAYLEKLPEEKEYILEVPSRKVWARLNNSGLPWKFVNEVLEQKATRFRDNSTFYAGKLQQTRGKTYLVAVAASNPYGQEEIANLSRNLIIGFLLSIAVVYVIGKRFTSHTFKPVRDIIQNVQGITASNLNLRLPAGNSKDELTELTLTFNDMLTRLETAFETQNNFVSNASHELRTPLTIIKGEAELALNKPGIEPEQQRSLELILRESEKLRDILTSLLGMAQSGFDGKKQNWELIRMDELLWMVKETADQINPQNNIQVDLSQLPEEEEMLEVNGNINLLKLAISNVVLNACKYSNNQEVILGISADEGKVTVLVQDKGIGIPEKELPYIFVPFFRASNTSDFEGHGVGLPLSLNIIRLHKGSIGIKTQEGAGTEIRIFLPAAVSKS